jgi:NAD dependent epimerase/dehydratase family enzyme
MVLETMLASQKVMPRRLLQAGFKFEDVELEPALRKMLRQEIRKK